MSNALWFTGLVLGCLVGQAGGQEDGPSAKPCPVVVARLYQSIGAAARPDLQPRVEIRRCRPEGLDLIQLVAFRGGSKKPDLVLDTGTIFVRQMLVAGSVFVFQLGGGSSDRVYVILTDKQTCRLAVTEYTKETATITSDGENITVEIPVWGRVKRYNFTGKLEH